ncbi:MAG: hypothetical protein U1F53_20580 [Burkholderiaceae bacterium]
MNPSRHFSAAVLAAAAALSGVAGSAGAASLTTVGSVDAAARPAGVPTNYVVTPNGLFHPSCVVALSPGEKLAADGAVLRADGSTRRAAGTCQHPRFVMQGGVAVAVPPGAERPLFSGWIAASDSDANVTPPASKMTGNYVVPSGPTTNVGQVLYYFPGLEDGQNVVTILQPVLAWNGFSDAKWTVTNWNCCKSGTTYHGSTIAAATGDKIKTSMAGSSCNVGGGTCPNWQIISTNKRTGQKTTFDTQSYGQRFTWYFGGAKEAYFVTQCSHFPANGSIKFSGLHVYDMAGAESTPASWSQFVSGGAPACHYEVATTTHTTKIRFDTSP